MTIELLLAYALGTVFFFAALMLTFGTGSISTHTSLESGTHITIDVTYDRDVLTHISSLSSVYASFARLSSFEKPFEEVRGGITYTLRPHFVSPCTAVLTSEARWLSSPWRERHHGEQRLVGSPSIAHALGYGGCDPLPPSSWRQPERTGGTNSGDILGIPTAFTYAYIESRHYMLVTTTGSVQSNDMWIIDVEDVSHPTVIASLETGDETHTGGLLDVTLVEHHTGNFAYALQDSSTNQLVVVDVSDPRTPVLVHTRSFEMYGVHPSGSNPEGRVITHYGNRLYVGLRTTIGPEFLVFDVEDNPRNPQFVGALPSSFDHSIYDIATNGAYAFLAIKPGNPPSGLPTRELIIIDVRGTPRDTGGGFNATNTTNDTEGAMSLYLIGNTLYMGRERVSNLLERDFYVLNVGSSTKPQYVKSRRLGIPTTSLHGTPRVLDVVVQGNRAFVGTTDPTRSLQIYDVSTDDTTLVPVFGGCVTTLAIPRLTKLAYRNNILYTLFGLIAEVGTVTDNTTQCPA